MKLFISWSGDRSQMLAAALREWLPLILHFAEPWLSQADIEAGERWGVEVAKELDASAFGITCVTAENAGAPWLLFEAGALAKSMQEGRVVPLLLDLDFQDISGPLAQFQAKKVERKGIFEVVSAINKSGAEPILEARLAQLFEALWPQLEQKLGEIPKGSASGKKIRSQTEVLEELVSSVRSLDLRLREDGDDPRRGRRSRQRIYMLEELASRLSVEGDPATSMLIAASFVRESHPWVYELTSEAARAVRARDLEKVAHTRALLERALEMPRGMSDESEFHAMHLIMREFSRALHMAEAGGVTRARQRPKPKTESQGDDEDSEPVL